MINCFYLLLVLVLLIHYATYSSSVAAASNGEVSQFFRGVDEASHVHFKGTLKDIASMDDELYAQMVETAKPLVLDKNNWGLFSGAYFFESPMMRVAEADGTVNGYSLKLLSAQQDKKKFKACFLDDNRDIVCIQTPAIGHSEVEDQENYFVEMDELAG